jgi:hypothetical protein
MLGSIARKVAWMARTTTTVVGLAIILALVLGVASTALAGTGVGATFNLGKINTVDAVSKLVGNVAGPTLKVDNNSAEGSATALDLQVEPGKAPMKVNSDGRVANLNADKLDGKEASAFMHARTYRVDRPIAVDEQFSIAVLCDTGDVALSSAWAGKNATTEITTAAPSLSNPGAMIFLIDNTSPLIDDMTLMASCADLPPLR